MTQSPTQSLTSEASLRQLGEDFCAGTIAKKDWTHQAHIAAAVYLIALCPNTNAEIEMPRMIRALNRTHGEANTSSSGYHHTIILAYLSAIRAFMLERQGLLPHEVENEAMGTPLSFLVWLLDYWSENLLFSPTARQEWVDSDRLTWPYPMLPTGAKVSK